MLHPNRNPNRYPKPKNRIGIRIGIWIGVRSCLFWPESCGCRLRFIRFVGFAHEVVKQIVGVDTFIMPPPGPLPSPGPLVLPIQPIPPLPVCIRSCACVRLVLCNFIEYFKDFVAYPRFISKLFRVACCCCVCFFGGDVWGGCVSCLEVEDKTKRSILLTASVWTETGTGTGLLSFFLFIFFFDSCVYGTVVICLFGIARVPVHVSVNELFACLCHCHCHSPCHMAPLALS